jgi:hypothetical protein
LNLEAALRHGDDAAPETTKPPEGGLAQHSKNYLEAAGAAAGAASEAAAEAAGAASEAAGAATGAEASTAGAGAGAASSAFLPQAARATAAITEANISDFFMLSCPQIKESNNYR